MKTLATAPGSDLLQLQQVDERARRLGWWFLAYLLLYPLPWLSRPPSTLDIVASLLGVAAFVPLYLRGFGRSDARALHGGLAVLAIGVVLQPFGGIWGIFVVYACGLLGGVLPRRRAWAALAGVALAVAALVQGLGLPLWDWLPTLFFGAMTAVISLYSASYTAQNEALAASRDEARRLAVVAERERIARDLHDLLGHTLTAVAVKADLAGRLLDAEPADPARARAEIEDIRRTARSALADVRAAVTGMRSTRLAHELAAARRALDSAGIGFSVHGVPPALPEPAETALAFVLLEGVTNVVRHAQARQCRVEFGLADGAVTLLVRDSRQVAEALPADGASLPPLAGPAPHAPGPAEGHGIAGMRQRLAEVGGTLALRFGPEGGSLLARVPMRLPMPDDAGTGATA